MKKYFLIIIACSSIQAMEFAHEVLDLTGITRDLAIQKLKEADPNKVNQISLVANGFDQWQDLTKFTRLTILQVALQTSLYGLYFQDSFRSLQVLILSGDSLKTLPPTISYLINLKKLYVNDNQLQKLPKELGKLKDLELLAVTNNKLTGFPESMDQLAALRVIYIDGNPWADDEIEKLYNVVKCAIIGRWKL